MLVSIPRPEPVPTNFGQLTYPSYSASRPFWECSLPALKTSSLRKIRIPKGKLHRLDLRRMPALGNGGNPKSERTATQSTSAEQGPKKARSAAVSAPDLRLAFVLHANPI